MRKTACSSLIRSGIPLRSVIGLMGRASSGQSLIEFALLFPVVFLLVVNVVNFGGLIYTYITVENASRSGASYMQLGGSSIGAPQIPTISQVQDFVHADLATSLAAGANAPVSVCGIQKDGGVNWISSYSPITYTACTMPTNPPPGSTYTDPQSSSFIYATVKVQYRYCPIIKGWNFPELSVYSTLPSCTGAGDTLSGGVLITRVAAMRVLQ